MFTALDKTGQLRPRSPTKAGCAQSQRADRQVDWQLFRRSARVRQRRDPETAEPVTIHDTIKLLRRRSAHHLDLSLLARLGGHSASRTRRGKGRVPGVTITCTLFQMFGHVEQVERSTAAFQPGRKQLRRSPRAPQNLAFHPQAIPTTNVWVMTTTSSVLMDVERARNETSKVEEVD